MLKTFFGREAGATFSKKNKGIITQALQLLATALRDAGIELDDETETPAKPTESATNNRAIAEAAGFSMADVATLIDTHLRASVPSDAPYDRIPQLADIYDDYFVYREGWRGPFFRVAYTLTENGGITFGTPILVVRKVQYVLPDNDLPVSESASAVIEIIGDDVELCERAVRNDGTARIKLIAPGIGSSGYYDPMVLQRDGPKVFTKNTQMFWDHPTALEERDRPEGSLHNLAAVLTSDAIYDANGPKGAGLYAFAEIRSLFRNDVDELAPHIGTSIRASGKAHMGEVQGRRMPIIDEITSAHSVDFVTKPGAGGAIIQMFEAAGRKRADTTLSEAATTDQPTGEIEMALTDADRAELATMIREGIAAGITAAVSPLQAQIAASRDASDLQRAEATVSQYLATIEGLPSATRARLAPEIARGFARTEAGEIDTKALTEAARQRVIVEMRYLRETGARIAIPAGFGDSTPLTEADTASGSGTGEGDTLEALFVSSWGLTEAGAKVAAKGRI